MKFTEKYQPQNLNQCLFPNKHCEGLVKNVAANGTDQNLVLFGPMGTGKSLIAKLIAKQLATTRTVFPEVIEGARLRTASKMDEVLDRIEKQRFLYNVLADRFLFIIEEFDRIPRPNQLEFAHLFTAPGLQFILTTNEVYKIDDRLLSRAQLCEVSGATHQDMEQLVQRVLMDEGVSATPTEVSKLIASVKGNVRDLMNGLEVLVMQKRQLQAPAVPQPVAPPPAAQAAPQPAVQPAPPASLAVTVTLPQQQSAPSVQPTP